MGVDRRLSTRPKLANLQNRTTKALTMERSFPKFSWRVAIHRCQEDKGRVEQGFARTHAATTFPPQVLKGWDQVRKLWVCLPAEILCALDTAWIVVLAERETPNSICRYGGSRDHGMLGIVAAP